MTIRVVVIAEETFGGNPVVPGFVMPADPPGGIFGNAAAFVLRERGKNGEEYFSLGVERVNVFFFEKDADAAVFELAHVVQTVQSVAREAADGFRDDHVDLSGARVADHFVKCRPLAGSRSA